MEYLIVIGISFLFSAIISIVWVRGIDHMNKNHPNYKGDDLFGIYEEEDKDGDGH